MRSLDRFYSNRTCYLYRAIPTHVADPTDLDSASGSSIEPWPPGVLPGPIMLQKMSNTNVIASIGVQVTDDPDNSAWKRIQLPGEDYVPGPKLFPGHVIMGTHGDAEKYNEKSWADYVLGQARSFPQATVCASWSGKKSFWPGISQARMFLTLLTLQLSTQAALEDATGSAMCLVVLAPTNPSSNKKLTFRVLVLTIGCRIELLR